MTEDVSTITAWLETASAEVAQGSWPWILGIALLVSLAALVTWRGVRAAFLWLHRRIASLQGARIHAIRYGGQDLFTQQEVALIILGLLRIVRYASYALLLYVYLLFAFGLFPATQDLAADLLGYFTGAVRSIVRSGIEFIPSLIFLIVLLLVTRGVINLMYIVFMRLWTGRVRLGGFPAEFAQPTYKILRFLVIIFAIMVAYPYLPGAKSPAFQAVSLFLGLLVSLGSSGAIANIVSGIALTYTRAFRVGDRVKIADAVGDVVEKTTFVTRVRTVKNVDITIPNAMVMNHHIINFSTHSKETGVIVHTSVTLGYDVDWRRVHEVLVEAARATVRVEAEPEPFVLQTSLDDFTVHYELNAYTREPEKMTAISSELHQNIQDGLHAAGIEIASPSMLQIRDGNQPALPDSYLPENYQPGGFRFLPIGSIKTGSG